MLHFHLFMTILSTALKAPQQNRSYSYAMPVPAFLSTNMDSLTGRCQQTQKRDSTAWKANLHMHRIARVVLCLVVLTSTSSHEHIFSMNLLRTTPSARANGRLRVFKAKTAGCPLTLLQVLLGDAERAIFCIQQETNWMPSDPLVCCEMHCYNW